MWLSHFILKLHFKVWYPNIVLSQTVGFKLLLHTVASHAVMRDALEPDSSGFTFLYLYGGNTSELVLSMLVSDSPKSVS